jgi:hypothetical protein
MRAIRAIKPLILGCAMALVLAVPAAAIDFSSARVSGDFVYQDGKPADNRQLHFQNCASGDMFVAPTDNEGDFAVYLPPGLYDLRAERGVVLKAKILVVGNDDFNIGRVVEAAPLDVRRPFERQGVAEAIVQSPAPTTANMKGRPMESLRHGHTLVQSLYGPAKPLPPIPAPEPALPPAAPAPSPAAAASPAAR